MVSSYGILAKAFRFALGAVHVGSSQETIVDGKKRNDDIPYLSGISQFRTCLANEYRKASKSRSHLGVVYLDLPNSPSARREEIAKCLLNITRNDNMILVAVESSFALIWPGLDRTLTAIFMLGLMNLLSGNFPDTLFKLNIAAYPENCTTLDELEAAAPLAMSGKEVESPQ